jgi:hypothetical protein
VAAMMAMRLEEKGKLSLRLHLGIDKEGRHNETNARTAKNILEENKANNEIPVSQT